MQLLVVYVALAGLGVFALGVVAGCVVMYILTARQLWIQKEAYRATVRALGARAQALVIQEETKVLALLQELGQSPKAPPPEDMN